MFIKLTDVELGPILVNMNNAIAVYEEDGKTIICPVDGLEDHSRFTVNETMEQIQELCT